MQNNLSDIYIMGFKLISKNNVGAVTTLILILLLSQSRLFDFLINTPLGRMVLLAMVILIAHTHKMLGLFAVLCIILAFNHNELNMVYGYNLYEGFDGSGNTTDMSGNMQDMSGNIQSKLASLQSKESSLEDKVKSIQQQIQTANANATNSTSSSSTSESFKGREGFCMTDRETTMLRGKQSSTVPVFQNLREQSDDVSPTDSSMFQSSYMHF